MCIRDSVCKARKDIPLSELLSNAVQRINGEIPELDNRVDEISDEQAVSYTHLLMDAKTIIAIVLVVFIVGAAVWLNIRNRKNK